MMIEKSELTKERVYEKNITFYFTPPRKFLHNSLNIAKISLCFCLVGCSSVSAEPAAEISQIDSFRGYDWGTTFDDIKGKEITSDMLEYRDYRIDEVGSVDGLTDLCIYNGSVDTYDTNVEYLFLNDKLVSGGYDMDIDDSNYEDICDGISKKYGDPDIEKSSTGWGDCSMWIDDSQNVILVSEMLGLLYFQNDESIIDLFSESLEKFHEIDIDRELQKAGDGYVGY